MEILGHISLETSLSDPVSFDVDISRKENAEPSIILAFLKPKIKIITPIGTETFAPYGEPSTEYRAVLKTVVMAAGFLVAAFIIYKFVK